MFSLIRRLPLVAPLVLMMFLPFLLFAFHYIEIPLFGVAVLVLLYLCLLIVQFEIGFFILIFARSSLDYVKTVTGGAVDLAGLVSLAIIVLAVFYTLYKRINIFRYAESLPFLIFLFAGTLSYGISSDLATSISDSLRMTSIFAVYLVTRIVSQNRHSVRTLFIVILASSLIPLGISIYQWASGNQMADASHFEYGRLLGTFSHPNAFASYLLILLIFNVVLILDKKPFVSRKMLLFLTSIALVVFLMTYSRGAWIAFVIALLVIGFIKDRRILIGLPLALLVLVATVPSVRERFDDILHPAKVSVYNRSALDWRKDAWGTVTTFYKKHPVVGNGLSSVEMELGFLTHNDYLRLLAETGVLGIAAYLYLMWVTLGGTWKDFRRTKLPETRAFNQALLAVLVSLLVREAADNTLRHTVVMIYLWALIAMGRALSEIERREASAR